ncbi:MAG: hypothetical protein PHT12_05615 [Patescibacteria group bacterium]|nr:hypothetical protein [Patescibacteria group bacterium]
MNNRTGVIHISLLEGSDADGEMFEDYEPSTTTATIYVAGGANVKVSWSAGRVDSIRWVPAGEEARHPHEADDEPYEYASTTFCDGDSGERFVCFGGCHFRFSCNEFGSGWRTDEDPTPCDGSCHAPVDSLPPFVVDVVRAFLMASDRPWAADW